MQITAFIPAFNEQAKVGATVEAVWGIDGIERVVVIDDGSTDDTRMAALIAGATVVRLDQNMGKGAALTAGISDAVFDACLFLDADLGSTASQANLLLQPVLAGQLDMSIARFPKPAKKVGFGKVKGLAARAIASVDPTFDCQAPLSGQRCITRACLEACLPLAQEFGVEVALTCKALAAGMRVGEVQTQMQHSPTGNDLAGMRHRARQYRDVKRTIEQLGMHL